MLLVILQLMGNNVASAVQTAGINLGMESLPPKKRWAVERPQVFSALEDAKR